MGFKDCPACGATMGADRTACTCGHDFTVPKPRAGRKKRGGSAGPAASVEARGPRAIGAWTSKRTAAAGALALACGALGWWFAVGSPEAREKARIASAEDVTLRVIVDDYQKDAVAAHRRWKGRTVHLVTTVARPSPYPPSGGIELSAGPEPLVAIVDDDGSLSYVRASDSEAAKREGARVARPDEIERASKGAPAKPVDTFIADAACGFLHSGDGEGAHLYRVGQRIEVIAEIYDWDPSFHEVKLFCIIR